VPDLAPDFCPYVGLQPFRVRDREYFFGREREQRVISANLFASPLTVLYGPSAVGKSSVLQAGVVPHLQREPRTAVAYFATWQARRSGATSSPCAGAPWKGRSDRPWPSTTPHRSTTGWPRPPPRCTARSS
jgi:hypothetical protein